MSFALFTYGGLIFLLRWIHFLAAFTWIGMLYYFNFVQGPYFGEADASSKSNAIQKLLPRALWWFRWGAMFTMISGVLLFGMNGNFDMHNPQALLISIGMLIALVMWFNVWFVIWPAQKVVIQSATQAASGGQPLPEAAARGARALVASRTNVLFSVPMLFFMGSASHLGVQISATANTGMLMGVLTLIIGALEFNALKGKLGPLTTVKGVIHCGLALTVVMYLIVEVLTK
ncbi:MAG: urate hydroxylase PuuD [Oligoflexia bacterium]|nr:urate hydroxylase PuuD [Oligoflexia bacterium]